MIYRGDNDCYNGLCASPYRVKVEDSHHQNLPACQPSTSPKPSTMSRAAIPRFLLPRGVHRIPYQSIIATSKSARHASSRPPPTDKSRILEKPAKFNPPSHGARLNKAPPRNYPGPALSHEAKQERATKQYPHMMPSEGTFMHWFLTNRSIHMWITLVNLLLPSPPFHTFHLRLTSTD